MINTQDVKNYELDWKLLESFLIQNKGYRYSRRKNTFVLPLPTREPERSKFESGFWPITGGIVRLLSNEPLIPEHPKLDENHILSIGKFDSEETSEWFKYFIKSQQRKIEETEISSLSQLPLLTLSEKKERNGQIDFINYVYGTLIEGNEEFLSPLFYSYKTLIVKSHSGKIQTFMSDKPGFTFHPFRLAAVGPLETIQLLWTQFPYY